jgi:ABC-type transport system involved in multi-copper enzyme maturation permease subunit
VFGLVGINETGFTIAGYQFPSTFNTILIPAETYYKYLFVNWAIPIWLGFCATVLALIAVGGIFPDLIGGGSIELYLSRPLSRVRLFLTKYAFALLFTALQVLLFSTASFLIIGLRCGAWEGGIFLAVPLVTLLFSYLYCICVLIGIVTRSTLAAILLSMMFWGVIYIVHFADMGLTTFTAAANERVERQKTLVSFNQEIIDRNLAMPATQRGNTTAFEFQRDRQKELLVEYEQTAEELNWWKRVTFAIKTPLPKTNETVWLMSRWLVEPDPIMAAERREAEEREQRRMRRGGPATRSSDRLFRIADDPEVEQQAYEEVAGRNVAWVVGTSLVFEALVLSLAAWVFCRRDY